MSINSQLRRRKLAREREALLFARVRDPDGSLAHASAVLSAAAERRRLRRPPPLSGDPPDPHRGPHGGPHRGLYRTPQERIDTVRSIFEGRPDHVRAHNAPVELHVWLAFALVAAALRWSALLRWSARSSRKASE